MKKSSKNKNKPIASSSSNGDPRFSQVANDPRFRALKRKEKVVKVDERFKGMFTEKRFTGGLVDKRGHRTTTTGENLKDHYELENEDNTAETVEIKDVRKKKGGVPDARGLESDPESSSSDEESDEEDFEEEIEHNWGELDKDAERTDETWRRLAVCNIDWDRIKAVDLFVLFNSFKPEKGVISSVKIYLSEFGRKRLAEEEVKGPAEIAETRVIKHEEDGIHHQEEDGEEEFMTEKLRQYQLNRLKYYYAVVECDSVETAQVLYKELDGFEYENSSGSLDLRYIPDEMEFDETPSSECSTLPEFATYKAPNFVTTALQLSKVKMTWDETDPSRQKKIDEAFNSKSEEAMNDLNAFLASSSGEESEEDDESHIEEIKRSGSNKFCKYKELLKSLDEEDDEDDVPEMDITFPDPGEESDESNIVSQPPEKETKQKRIKKEKPQEVEKNDGQLDLLVMDDKDESKHFNYDDVVKEYSKKKKKKSKGKKAGEESTEKNDNFEFDADDVRFSKLFSSPNYNIDPSDPHFKKTNAMERLIQKKMSSTRTMEEFAPSKTEKKTSTELSSLVKSIKRKAENLNVKSKKKLPN